MKKILALMIAVLMIVASMSVAFADDETPTASAYDSTVSVTGLMAGDAYKLYQVLTWNQTAGEWQLAEGFTGLTDAAYNSVFATDENENTTRAQEVVAAIVNGITQDEANAIAAMTALASGAPSTKDTGTIAESATSFEYTLGNNASAAGLYMALITAGTPEYVYNPVFVSSDFSSTNATNTIDASTANYDSNGIAKREQIHLTKTTSDTNESLQEAINSYVGETVTFDVNTTIPVFLDSYKNPYFQVFDNITTSGIDLIGDSIEITLGTGANAKTYAKTASADPEKLAYAGDIFTVTPDEENDQYTVLFNKTWLGNNTTAVPVHIQYKGTITNEADFNLNEDSNTVTVTYSNGPDNEKGAMRDQTNHYTFSIGAKAVGESSDEGKTYELVKVAVDADGNPIVEKRKVTEWSTKEERHPLAGATFGLYTDAACTTLYTNSLYPDGATFETLEDGVITFKGLAAGEYWLQEISAPTSYIKDLRKVHIEIEAHYKDFTVADATEGTGEDAIKVKGYTTQVLDWYKVKVNNVSTYDGAAGENGQYGALPENQVVETQYTFNNDGPHTSTMTTTETNDSDLTNTKGVELPSTGGMGTTILYVGGSILVLLAVILLVTKRRMNANDD